MDFSSSLPLILAIAGAAISVILGGIGSILGVRIAGEAGAGVTTERPEAFGKILLIQALPGTQGIYGFIGALMIMVQIGLIAGNVVDLNIGQGFSFFLAGLPVGFASLFSGIYQGRVSAAGMNIIAKDPANTGKAMILSAMVETYAVLGLLISIMMIFGVKLG